MKYENRRIKPSPNTYITRPIITEFQSVIGEETNYKKESSSKLKLIQYVNTYLIREVNMSDNETIEDKTWLYQIVTNYPNELRYLLSYYSQNEVNHFLKEYIFKMGFESTIRLIRLIIQDLSFTITEILINLNVKYYIEYKQGKSNNIIKVANLLKLVSYKLSYTDKMYITSLISPYDLPSFKYFKDFVVPEYLFVDSICASNFYVNTSNQYKKAFKHASKVFGIKEFKIANRKLEIYQEVFNQLTRKLKECTYPSVYGYVILTNSIKMFIFGKAYFIKVDTINKDIYFKDVETRKLVTDLW